MHRRRNVAKAFCSGNCVESKTVALNPPPAAKLLHVPSSRRGRPLPLAKHVTQGEQSVSMYVCSTFTRSSFFFPPSPETEMITQPNKFSVDTLAAQERKTSPCANGTFSDLLYDQTKLSFRSARWRRGRRWGSRRSHYRSWYFSSTGGRFGLVGS